MSDEQWIHVAELAELAADDVTAVHVAGREIAVYRVGAELYATDAQCTHGNARLCDGFLEGHEIECPLHQGRFDVRDGRPACAPASVALRCHPIRLEEGRVYVRIGA